MAQVIGLLTPMWIQFLTPTKLWHKPETAEPTLSLLTSQIKKQKSWEAMYSYLVAYSCNHK